MSDYIIDMTFDSAIANGMSLAAIEAAREAGQAFADGTSWSDPQGEPSYDPQDLDDFADRVSMVAERRMRILRLPIRPAGRKEFNRTHAGVHIVIRRNGQVWERGDATIPVRPLRNELYPDEVEIVLAVRLPRRQGSDQQSGYATKEFGGPEQRHSEVILQASARSLLE
ncbi:hypothetical protein GC163_17865 [bacterium]|nr:hypothetical protein [bacterium]